MNPSNFVPGRRRALVLAAGTLLPLGPAAAAVVLVEGQGFEREVTVAGTRLLLNGTGVRAVAWFRGYAAGLYLARVAPSAAQALATPGPKRLQLRMLQDVPAAEFEKAFTKGMRRNAADADWPGLEARMAAFGQTILAVGQVRKGDVVDLDLDPARGTLFSLNGAVRGPVIAGADFYGVLLASFVGDRPYDARLKAGLLGQ